MDEIEDEEETSSDTPQPGMGATESIDGVAQTLAAGPEVLLVTSGSYSDYGVRDILLIPAGRNAARDVAAYRESLEQRQDAFLSDANFVIAHHGDAQIPSVADYLTAMQLHAEKDAARKKLAKGTPERAALWKQCRELERTIEAKEAHDRRLQDAAYTAAVRGLCGEHGIPFPEPTQYVDWQEWTKEQRITWDYGQAMDLFDRDLLVAWLMRRGYRKANYWEAHEAKVEEKE